MDVSKTHLNCRDVEEFNKLDMIGEGTYGVVFMAKDKKTDQPFAIKKMRVLDPRQGFPITSLREIKILKTLSQHPNIVKLKDVVVGAKKSSVFLVFEYCDIDLFKLVSQMLIDKLYFQQSEVKCLVLQLMKGMQYVHEKFIIHRDIKLSNLLLNKNGILKIADFGLARQYQSPLKPITKTVVTLWYRSPELLLKNRQYGTSVDVWSIGCIIGELLNKGDPLFKGNNEINQFHLICQMIGYPTKQTWPDFFHENKKSFRREVQRSSIFRKNNIEERFSQLSNSKNCCDLMHRILCWDPSQRISLQEALGHPYFIQNPKPCFPDELKVLSRLDFYAKKSIEDFNRKKISK